MPKSIPLPDRTSAFFWSAASESRLAVQRCNRCGAWHHPPVIACPQCQSEDVRPTDVSGRGTVYSFTVVRQAFDPAYAEELPYLVALVELEEDPSLRLLSNLVELEVPDAAVGMPVEVVFVERNRQALPMFRPRNDS